MIFKRLSLEYYTFAEEGIGEIRQLLSQGLTNMKVNRDKPPGEVAPSSLPDNRHRGTRSERSHLTSEEDRNSYRSRNDDPQEKPRKKRNVRRAGRRRDQHQVVVDLCLALILCHNVTPVFTTVWEEDDPQEGSAPDDQERVPRGVSRRNRDFQAASPDEIALVKFAETLGMVLLERDESSIKIKNAIGDEQEFEILENFPFSSETKRMGIIVR
jgi:phospholipid-translocating ATPase